MADVFFSVIICMIMERKLNESKHSTQSAVKSQLNFARGRQLAKFEGGKPVRAQVLVSAVKFFHWFTSSRWKNRRSVLTLKNAECQ